jgi:DNA-binding PadR family transcriptional regulator
MESERGLGELELILLLAIMHMNSSKQDAYGSAIRREVVERSGRLISRGSLYVTLDRLEEKGFLASSEGASSEPRGFAPKRVFAVTSKGAAGARASLRALLGMSRGLSIPELAP